MTCSVGCMSSMRSPLAFRVQCALTAVVICLVVLQIVLWGNPQYWEYEGEQEVPTVTDFITTENCIIYKKTFKVPLCIVRQTRYLIVPKEEK